MRSKASFLLLNICYLLFACNNPEDIERPLPDYIIDYYGDCTTCPEENFIDLKVNDSSLYFQMGRLNLDSILEPDEIGRSGFFVTGQGVNVLGFGSRYFGNRDSVQAIDGENLSVTFNIYNDQRICSDHLFLECGSYLFNNTFTPEGDLTGTNDAYGLQIGLRYVFYSNTPDGLFVDGFSFISHQNNGFFDIIGKERNDVTAVVKICGTFSSTLIGANDSLVNISGRYAIEYYDLIIRNCSTNR